MQVGPPLSQVAQRVGGGSPQGRLPGRQRGKQRLHVRRPPHSLQACYGIADLTDTLASWNLPPPRCAKMSAECSLALHVHASVDIKAES